MGRAAQCPLVQRLSHFPRSPKSPSTSLPHAHGIYSPCACMLASILSLTPCLLPFKKINISPQQLEGALKHFSRIDASPMPLLSNLFQPQGLHTCCSLHGDCPSSDELTSFLLILGSINVPSAGLTFTKLSSWVATSFLGATDAVCDVRSHHSKPGCRALRLVGPGGQREQGSVSEGWPKLETGEGRESSDGLQSKIW